MNQIAVSIASGEAGRIKLLEAALKGDNRFMPLQIAADLPVDMRFKVTEHIGHDLLGEEYAENILNIELKEPNDFVQSVLNGHLQEQVLSIRERREDGCIVILGDLDAIYEAIKDSATGQGIKRSEVGHVIASAHARCKSFRKRSMLNGVPVFFKGDDSGFFDSKDQWKDILELAVDYLTDGSMMGFRQRPAEGERDLLAASILFHGDGIGPGVLKPVMEDYALRLVPRKDPARLPCDMPGIGPKRAAVIDQKISMVYGMT